jgi:hypothetical protein
LTSTTNVPSNAKLCCTWAPSTSSPAARASSCGPPRTGKTHLAIALGIRARHAGHRVAFATAVEWVARLADAQSHRYSARYQPSPAQKQVQEPASDEVGNNQFERVS